MYVCARIKFSTWWPTLGENLFAENLHTGCFRDRDVRKYFPNSSAQELLDRRNNIEFISVDPFPRVSIRISIL